jgi:hypothetical protein
MSDQKQSTCGYKRTDTFIKAFDMLQKLIYKDASEYNLRRDNG